MTGDWKQFEGQVFHDKFPLQRLLGSTSHSAVFLTQSPPPQPKTIAIKFISSSRNADSQTSLLHRAAKLRHPNLLRLLPGDRKSTRLNSSHVEISYAVFCLKKKNKHSQYIYPVSSTATPART